ncbi:MULTISPECIES: hypothetical protein [Arthrobacter]|uniref:Uncharacterized protein n=2 Tax=Arthrobacter TaxID=1663 RepID=A0ABU9KH51_9MICC|nr:hypothetical protein [Arthrobacter sp. YJM1]MDP5226224.1 hypothetical protein [Arthrobacter sp. YJM1]
MAADDGKNSGGSAPEGHEPQDEDAIWAELVARLEATPSGPLPEDEGPIAEPRFASFDPLGLSRADSLPLSAGQGPRDHVPDPDLEDDSDAFVPEDPEIFSNADPRLVLAWAGAAGAPMLLVVFLIFWRSAPGPLWWLLVAAFAAGTGYLLWRLPHGTDGDDRDDGARI